MRFRSKLFCSWVGLTLVLWCGAYFGIRASVQRGYERMARARLSMIDGGLKRLYLDRASDMYRACNLVTNIPELRALIAEQSYEFVPENLASLQERLDYLAGVVGVNFVVALSRNQTPIAQNRSSPWPTLADLDAYCRSSLPAESLIHETFFGREAGSHETSGPPPLSNQGKYGLWVYDDQLLQVAVVPLVFDSGREDGPGRPEGALVMGARLTDKLATELGNSQDCEVSFLSQATCLASSLTSGRQQELIEQFRAGSWPAAGAFVMRLAGISYWSRLQPLIDPCSGATVGTVLIQHSQGPLLAFLREISRSLTGIMAVGLLAAALVSFALSSAITRPVNELAHGVREVAQGNLSLALEPRGRDELGELATSFNEMVDQLRSRRDLQRRVDEAQAANRAKSEFLANMSHEIRTPLNAILGFADLLRRGGDEETEIERKECLETIHASGTHLLNLINDILDLSKIESGQLTMESLRCSVSEVIAEVVSVLRVSAQSKGLALEVAYVGPIPATIATDPSRLRQLLMNLIGNAIKFTEDGGVRVVTQLAEDGDGPKLRIEVIDTGIGIAPEKLACIFDPFVQADSSVTRRFGGTGLGLAICNRLAKALGGQITVSSTSGQGSVFAVEIDPGPIDGVEMIEAPMAHEVMRMRPPRSRLPLPPLNGRVLLVEDGDTNRRLTRLVLERAGAIVATAENGRDGVELARRDPFDLILMDMQMPIMDGYRATSRLRELGVMVPIIALTANAMEEDKRKCIAAGCSGYLSKPIETDLLIRAVAEALGDQNTRQATVDRGGGESPGSGPPLVSTLPLEDLEFREIVEEFAAKLPERLAAMRDAWQATDLTELAGLAHSLKGAGGSVGFSAFTQPAADLERYAKEGRLDRIERALDVVVRLASRVTVASEPVSEGMR
jgi:signal transduction histidine kinase/DNA-binding NarL/FixJ family response regulator